jgi:hypothetical protein
LKEFLDKVSSVDLTLVTSMGKRKPQFHDQQGCKKHPSRFVGCDGHFYGLGLLVKYDKKP